MPALQVQGRLLRRRDGRLQVASAAWPSTDANLVQEKVDQAAGILREQDVDLWLTLVRETLLTSDPCLELIAGDVQRVDGRVPDLGQR